MTVTREAGSSNLCEERVQERQDLISREHSVAQSREDLFPKQPEYAVEADADAYRIRKIKNNDINKHHTKWKQVPDQGSRRLVSM